MSSQGKIVVTGLAFYYPLAGVTYQHLHYLIGLQRLGYDVYYIEDCTRGVYDPYARGRSLDASRNVGLVSSVLERYGMKDRWAFRESYEGGRCYGMSEQLMRRHYGECDALLNVTGAQDIEKDQLECRRRVLIESDPFRAQVKAAENDSLTLAHLSAHDTHFSFGENLGQPDCDVPVDDRFRWLPTRQPVVMDIWAQSNGQRAGSYTTVTTWKNRGKDIVYRGSTHYWTKDREFERFLDVPRMREVTFEMATAVDRNLETRLRDHGWKHASSRYVSEDADRYRKYIQDSRGEFTVARDQYVRPRTGWFSDRSACYLAAGRPVITQETGFSKFIPAGEGLFSFTTVEEVLSAIDAIESDYSRHSRAALELAAEYFGAERVLASLMSRAGL